MVSGAAEYGQMEILEYLHAKGVPMEGVLMGACAGGHQKVINWAYSKGIQFSEFDLKFLISTLVTEQKLERFLDWALEKGCVLDDYAMSLAVTKHGGRYVDLLLSKNCPFTWYTVGLALKESPTLFKKLFPVFWQREPNVVRDLWLDVILTISTYKSKHEVYDYLFDELKIPVPAKGDHFWIHVASDSDAEWFRARGFASNFL